MKKNLLKTLLIIAALAMGTSAWGDTTNTSYDFEDGKVLFTNADANRLSLSVAKDETLGSNVLKVNCTNANVIAFAYYDFSSLVENAVRVRVGYDCNITQGSGQAYISLSDAKRHTLANAGFAAKSNSGYGKVGSIFAMGCHRASSKNYFAINAAKKDAVSFGEWIHVEIEVNLKTRKCNYTITSKDDATELSSGILNFYNEEVETCSQIDFYSGYVSSPVIQMDNLSITVESDANSYAAYKINYVDSDDKVLSSLPRKGLKGSKILLNTEDKEPFKVEDIKYIYVSDNSNDVTVEEDGSTVVKIICKEAEKYSYKVNAVSGSTVLKELVSGTQYEGERARAFYSKAFNRDGKWYMTEGNSAYPTYAKDFTEEGVLTVEFAESDIAYFSEIEDLTPSASWAASGTVPDRYSNGKAVRLTKNSYVSTAPIESGGIYSVTVWARNNSSSQRANIPTIGIKDSEGKITDLGVTFAEPWGTNTGISKTLDNVVIPEGYSLVLNNTSSWYSNLQLDYIYLKKTGELTQDVAVSAAGLATYCAPVAIDFSSASKVAAYKAVVNGTTVNLTKVTSAAAGEGVLLRSVGGGATSEPLPVLATATKAEDNAFVGTLSDINVLEDDGTNINYVLSKEGNEVGFYKAAKAGTKVGAGKAYLPVAKSNTAKSLTFVYSDDATGISEIATDVNRTADGAIYSLSGVRVQNPSKGLYIMNGKKVIVK